MAVLMFWNTKGRPLYNEVRHLCREHDVDVAIFAEPGFNPVTLLTTLNTDSGQPFIQLPATQKRILFFTRYQLEWFEPRFDDGYTSIQHLKLPLGPPVLIAAVHLPSKLFASTEDQTFYASSLSSAISLQEDYVGHRSTIVIGDFNMDPFETGMTIAGGLHALMDRNIVRRIDRKINDVDYLFFYNPMWSRLGDSSVGPPGTYFYNSSKPMNYYWHTFDQILLRPSLIDAFDIENLRVVTSLGGQNLLRQDGRVDDRISDHLPIVLRLDLEGRL